MLLSQLHGSRFGFHDVVLPPRASFPFSLVPKIHESPLSILADYPALGYEFVVHEGEVGSAKRDGEPVRIIGCNFGGLFFLREVGQEVFWGSDQETLRCNSNLINFARTYSYYISQVCLLK